MDCREWSNPQFRFFTFGSSLGDSIGGNMATVVALLAEERGGPHIFFQLLFYPVTDANFDTPSYLKYQEGYCLLVRK